MVDKIVEDVSPRVMELLRIFLAASSRDEHALLVLETRNGRLTTKYRSVEIVAGDSTTDSLTTKPKSKNNPARARRSRLRLEQFNKRKVEEKQTGTSSGQQTGNQNVCELTAGDTSSSTNKLVIELANEQNMDGPVEKVTSPIPQVDGQEDSIAVQGDVKVTYTFVSDYGEEDIIYSLSEIFPETEKMETTLVSRVQVRPRSAHHMCTVAVKRTDGRISWPDMTPSNAEVFQDLKRIKM